jgi:hypothetical protein
VTEEAVVEKVSSLMTALDDVNRYRELARAMVDFVAIIAASLILAILLNFAQDVYDVAFSWTSGIGPTLLGGMPASFLTEIGTVLVPLGGLAVGSIWVGRRVGRIKAGEWKGTLTEGTPGAVKLLSGIDWNSVLSAVRVSRVAFLLYALVKVAGYTIFAMVLLFFASFFLPVPLLVLPASYLFFISVTVVLLLTSKSLSEGLRRLMSLDQLFWDLRVFSTEFNRAEFNKA